MKIFDTEEQNIIRKITQGSDESRTFINIFYSLYSRHLQDVRIEIDKDNGTVKFLFQIQKPEPTDNELKCILEKEKQLSNLLIKYLTLIRYLEKEEYIILFDEAKPSSSITFGWGAVNMPSTEIPPIDDQLLIYLLMKYAGKRIMLFPSLRKLEANNFKFDEEIRFNKQYEATWYAIKISFCIGVATIIITFLSMCYGIYSGYKNSSIQERQFKTQLIENRKIAESIIKEIKELKNPKTDIEKPSEERSNLTAIYEFLKNNMAYIIGFSTFLQIIGTLMLALFSFFGIKITESGDVRINNKPNTHVTINNNWLRFARGGLIILIIGILLSGIAGVIASMS